MAVFRVERNKGYTVMSKRRHLDYKKEALKLLLKKDGKVTRYSVIYDKDFQLEKLYDSLHFHHFFIRIVS